MAARECRFGYHCRWWVSNCCQPTERQEKWIIFSFSLLILLKPFNGGLRQPLSQRLLGVGYAWQTNHAAGGANDSIMVGKFFVLVFN